MLLRILGVASLMTFAVTAQPAPVRHFLFRLEPVRADFTLQSMTEAERPVVGQHAGYLKTLLDQGKLVLAGQAFDPKGFWGIVIVNAADQEEATGIMNADPAIKSNLFRGVAIPFRIVFQRPTAAP
jgi:uncharacterized protein